MVQYVVRGSIIVFIAVYLLKNALGVIEVEGSEKVTVAVFLWCLAPSFRDSSPRWVEFSAATLELELQI